MQYTILDRNEVDEKRWDETVKQTPYAPPYALHWYLDAATNTSWKGIIAGDYELVMPLPFKQRPGLKQVYQPPLCQQLGIYGKHTHRADIEGFLNTIPKKYQPATIPVNAKIEPRDTKGWTKSSKDNYVLHLGQPYSKLRSQYSQGMRSHINKNKEKLEVHPLDDFNELQTHFTHLVGHRIGLPKKQLQTSQRILKEALERQHGFMISVHGPDGEWAAQLYFLRMRQRIIKIRAIANKIGRKYCANHVGIDHIIQKYSNQDMILDFEGSSIPGVAAFFKGFGPTLEPFYLYEREGLIQKIYNKWKSGNKYI